MFPGIGERIEIFRGRVVGGGKVAGGRLVGMTTTCVANEVVGSSVGNCAVAGSPLVEAGVREGSNVVAGVSV